ncbi:MAG: ferrous iron transport protein A [Promethearchaeota archaeon]
MTEIPLNKLSIGDVAEVVTVQGTGQGQRRILDMGLVPGTKLKMVRTAPLGDPVEFIVRGYALTLRKQDAANVIVHIVEHGRLESEQG